MALDTTGLAATLQDRQQGYVDVISSMIPLFQHLRSKGSYVSKGGGSQLEWNLEFKLDSEEPSFAGYDTLAVYAQDSVQTATATWKSYYKPIALNGEEVDLNNAKRVFSLVMQKEKNALTSMQQQMNDHFYLDGTGNSSKQITGLAAIISTTPTTGTLFGINRATSGNEFWRNQKKDSNSAAFLTTAETFIMRNDMDELYITCGRQKVGPKSKQFPDLILGTETYWRLYSQGVDRRGQRFTNTMSADAGYTSLEFRGATLIHDEDMPADAGTDAQAYFINSEFLKLMYVKSANFKITDRINAESQDAFSKRIIWRGELVSTNPQKLGLHEGVKAFAAS